MVKLLILSANPKNTDPLRLGEEVREIQVGLERARYREQFTVVQRSAVRVDDLRQALLTEQPRIVHFSGHGAGEQGLVLEDATGRIQLVSTAALGELFGLLQCSIDCVVLNACYTEAQLDAIHQHIDTVVGMNQAIGDRAAIQFAVGFYEALGAGESYAQAYRFGCNALRLQGIDEALTPILRSRMQAQPPATGDRAQPESPTRVVSPDPASITMTAGDNAKQFAQFHNDGGTVNFN